MKKNSALIERYLRQEMSPEELSHFTLQMVMDKNLRKEVEQMRTIFKTIRSEDRRVHQGGINQWIYVVAALGLLILGSLYVLNKNDGSSTEIEQIEAPAKKGPIAAYEKESYLENITSGTRNLGLAFSIAGSFPKGEHYLNAHNLISFKVNAELTGSIIPEILELTIWNNNYEDFENANFEYKETLKVTENSNLDFQSQLNLQPGLYYYLISLKRSGDLVKGGSFSVHPK